MVMFNKLCVVLYAILAVGSVEYDRYIGDTINFLENILNWCIRHETLIDVNLLFGVAIVSGQLRFVDKNNMKYKNFQAVTRINDLCNIIFGTAYRLNIADINSDKTQKMWLSPKLWSFDLPMTHLQSPSSPEESIILAEFERNVIDTTTFHVEYESCAKHLIEECCVSKYCAELILDGNNGGYILTHQILYLHVLRQLAYQIPSCSLLKRVSMNALHRFLNDKCYEVREQLEKAESQVLHNATLLDWFIEGVVVCGLQNLAEFFELKYINYIIGKPILDVTSNRYAEINNGTVHMMSVRMGAGVLYLKQFSKKRIHN